MALHKKPQFYLSVFENVNLIIDKTVSDSNYPHFTALFPYHELEDDGEGNMVPAASPTPNANFGNRIRYNFRKPSDRNYNTEITNLNISNNVYELKSGILPGETERLYIILPIKPELAGNIADLIADITAMRASLATALSRSIDWYQFGVITAEQLEQFFDKPTE